MSSHECPGKGHFPIERTPEWRWDIDTCGDGVVDGIVFCPYCGIRLTPTLLSLEAEKWCSAEIFFEGLPFRCDLDAGHEEPFHSSSGMETCSEDGVDLIEDWADRVIRWRRK